MEDKPKTLLTQEQLDKFKKKKWANLRDTDKEHLTGPITEEGKEKALRNLRPYTSTKKAEPEEDIDFPEGETESALSSYMVLNNDEKRYYVRRWGEYKQDFDIQTAADEALLRDVIMEEIIINRLRTLTFQNEEKTDMSERMKKSMDRRKDAFSKLSTIRKQKWQRLDEEASLARLILEWDKRRLLYDATLDEKLEEEKELLDKNMKQFEADLVESREGYTGTESIDFTRPEAEEPVPAEEPTIWNTIALT